MNKLITWETIHNFAYVNDAVCTMPVRGIMLSFYGLSTYTFVTEDTPDGILFGKYGILVVIPYCNPWSWMNNQAAAYTDEILDVLFAHFRLSESVPVISTGASMGGLAALTYCAKARRTPAACFANCPVCDLPYHFTERPDLPRTLYSAFWDFTCSMDEAMKTSSPLHLVPEMPSIPYTLYHGDADRAVNKGQHSDRFVAAMRERGHSVTYIEIPGRDHGHLQTPEKEMFEEAVIRACGI